MKETPDVSEEVSIFLSLFGLVSWTKLSFLRQKSGKVLIFQQYKPNKPLSNFLSLCGSTVGASVQASGYFQTLVLILFDSETRTFSATEASTESYLWFNANIRHRTTFAGI